MKARYITGLTQAQKQVLAEQGTEYPGSGEYCDHFAQGVYHCVACDTPLFTSKGKFESGCGWPAFTEAVNSSVTHHADFSHNMQRTEVKCATCEGHLGNVFNDGPPPSGIRYCINSICLDFKAD